MFGLGMLVGGLIMGIALLFFYKTMLKFGIIKPDKDKIEEFKNKSWLS